MIPPGSTAYSDDAFGDLLPADAISLQDIFPQSLQRNWYQRLMLALLDNAIQMLSGRYQSDRLEAEWWIMAGEPEDRFSMESVCEALGLDPSYVRRGLQKRYKLRPKTKLTPPGWQRDRRLQSRDCDPITTVEAIQALVCTTLNISMDDLLGPARHARFVLPRHIALYLCACYTDTALIDISFKFGARNHTAAWDAMQRIKRKAARFPHVQRIVDILKTKILTAAGRV